MGSDRIRDKVDNAAAAAGHYWVVFSAGDVPHLIGEQLSLLQLSKLVLN